MEETSDISEPGQSGRGVKLRRVAEPSRCLLPAAKQQKREREVRCGKHDYAVVTDPSGQINSCRGVSCCFLWVASELATRQVAQRMGDHPRVAGSLRQISSFPKVGIPFNRPVGDPAVDAIGYEQIRQHGVANVEALGQLESLGVQAISLASTFKDLQSCQLV
jgi:hypothetical protein